MSRPVSVTYRIWATPAEVASAAAELFTSVAAEAAAGSGAARIAISGGTTPKAMFALLADRSAPYFARMPWSQLHLFWVDERCVPPTDAESNFRMTDEAMLQHVPLPAEQIHRMEGELDPAIAAARYAAELRAEFGPGIPLFDLVLLGMGDDGHTASLFPHMAALSKVAFLIEGAGKAQVVHDVFLGPYDPESKPSQLIRPANGELTLLLDAAAASKLPVPIGAVAGGRLEIS